MSINLHLSSAEAERLVDLLAWASEHLSDDHTSDPGLRALAPIAERVLELVEAETVEGMIERGEIEQGALADDVPSYTCPKCHRGVMQSLTDFGDGWALMECSDCGHTEQVEAK